MTGHTIEQTLAQRRTVWTALALRSAVAFRDCAQREQPSEEFRRECRGLMREQALRWREISQVEE